MSEDTPDNVSPFPTPSLNDKQIDAFDPRHGVGEHDSWWAYTLDRDLAHGMRGAYIDDGPPPFDLKGFHEKHGGGAFALLFKKDGQIVARRSFALHGPSLLRLAYETAGVITPGGGARSPWERLERIMQMKAEGTVKELEAKVEIARAQAISTQRADVRAEGGQAMDMVKTFLPLLLEARKVPDPLTQLAAIKPLIEMVQDLSPAAADSAWWEKVLSSLAPALAPALMPLVARAVAGSPPPPPRQVRVTSRPVSPAAPAAPGPAQAAPPTAAAPAAPQAAPPVDETESQGNYRTLLRALLRGVKAQAEDRENEAARCADLAELLLPADTLEAMLTEPIDDVIDLLPAVLATVDTDGQAAPVLASEEGRAFVRRVLELAREAAAEEAAEAAKG